MYIHTHIVRDPVKLFEKVDFIIWLLLFSRRECEESWTELKSRKLIGIENSIEKGRLYSNKKGVGRIGGMSLVILRLPIGENI